MELKITLIMSLNEALQTLGYTTGPHLGRGFQGKAIYRPDGSHVGDMTANECWQFLRREHRERFDYTEAERQESFRKLLQRMIANS